MKLKLKGPYIEHDGYGTSCINFASHLKNFHGLEIIQENYNEYFQTGEDVTLIYFLPQFFPTVPAPNHRVGMTMCETTKIPKIWVDSCNQVELLLVPSTFCKEVFQDCGVTVPIEVAPLGVDIKIFTLLIRKHHKLFTFLTYGRLDERKNWQYLVDEFTTAFPDNPDVRLVLKTMSNTVNHKPFNFKSKDPRISVIDEIYDYKQLLELIAQADCGVFVSHGEGYGLPARECLATGLPVIILGDDINGWNSGTGMTDMLKFPGVFPVDAYWDTADASCYHGPDIGNETDLGDWLVGNPRDLKGRLRFMLNNRYESLLQARVGSTAVMDCSMAALRLYDILNFYFGG